MAQCVAICIENRAQLDTEGLEGHGASDLYASRGSEIKGQPRCIRIAPEEKQSIPCSKIMLTGQIALWRHKMMD
jgi:hypothetical protein